MVVVVVVDGAAVVVVVVVVVEVVVVVLVVLVVVVVALPQATITCWPKYKPGESPDESQVHPFNSVHVAEIPPLNHTHSDPFHVNAQVPPQSHAVVVVGVSVVVVVVVVVVVLTHAPSPYSPT